MSPTQAQEPTQEQPKAAESEQAAAPSPTKAEAPPKTPDEAPAKPDPEPLPEPPPPPEPTVGEKCFATRDRIQSRLDVLEFMPLQDDEKESMGKGLKKQLNDEIGRLLRED